VENHIFWKNRDQFVLLMDNFINGIKFSDTLSVLDSKTLDAVESFETKVDKLTDFQPDIRSNGFGCFISFLYRESEAFEPNSTFVELNIIRESHDYTEEKLRDSVRNILLEIQKHL
jgi:hypothetical protein